MAGMAAMWGRYFEFDLLLPPLIKIQDLPLFFVLISCPFAAPGFAYQKLTVFSAFELQIS